MKCSTKWCRKPRCKKGGKYCSKCKMRVWRACNPTKARLAWLRNKAAKKKLPFDLDLKWLGSFLERNSYDKSIHHIDRISVLKGYTRDNLQVLLCGDNVAKGNRERGPQLQIL